MSLLHQMEDAALNYSSDGPDARHDEMPPRGDRWIRRPRLISPTIYFFLFVPVGSINM